MGYTFSGLLKEPHINKIQGLFMDYALGVPEVVDRMSTGTGFKKAMETTFSKGGNGWYTQVTDDAGKTVNKFDWGKVDYGKVAASGSATIFGANVVGGALAGGFTDNNGNFDVQGIPLI